jgi:undecaprenyl-diphosphatase
LEPRHLPSRPAPEPTGDRLAGGGLATNGVPVHDPDGPTPPPRHLARPAGRPAHARRDGGDGGPYNDPGRADVAESKVATGGRPSPLVVAGLVLATLVAVVAVTLAARDAAARAEAGDRLGAADAVVLGLVEGVTEWLPISSTGHLTVTQDLLKIDGDAADSYAIAIQSGAILAVLILFRERFTGMVNGLRGRDPEGRTTLIAIVVACLPAVVIGLTLEDVIKDNLFGTGPVVAAWFVGGLVILAVARHRRGRSPDAGDRLAALTWQKALIIGVAQSCAMWPGVSRSLVTIVAATALGLAVPAAVEFSFLLGFVTLGGATAYEMLSSGDLMLEAYGIATPVLGLVVAFVSAVAAMRWMVGYLQRHGLEIFGWYRIALAIVVGGLLLAGVV